MMSFKKTLIAISILSLVVYGFYSIGTKKTLPPTNMQNHIEMSPRSHILHTPMKLAVQKHMLEHVDGKSGSRGGIIINYDCKNYACEEGMIENLESFADEFDFVYVAPYKNMQVKIALTRLGRIETMNEYDSDKIRAFIGAVI